MRDIADGLSDEDIRAVALYFEWLRPAEDDGQRERGWVRAARTERRLRCCATAGDRAGHAGPRLERGRGAALTTCLYQQR